VIGNGVVVDPATLLDEIKGLHERGVKVEDNLRISDRAHLVMPYHKLQDALQEAAVSKARGEQRSIGTTGRGIGPTYADKAARSTAIRFADLLDPDRFVEKLQHTVTVKNAVLGALAQVADQPFDPIDADALADQTLIHAAKLRPHICNTTQLLHTAMADGKRLLFEGANACMLDVDHGTYPYVTSSNCSSLGIYPGTGVPGGALGRVVGIAKAYTTRVGGGPFVTEQDNQDGQRIRDRGNEYGTTTGRPRRCGWLDLMVVKYSATVCGATEIALMLLDVLAGFDTLKVCVGYEVNGKALDFFPSDAEVLRNVEPVYEQVPGFADEVTDIRDYADLPTEAKGYVELIERIVGVPVKTVSVGPQRDATLLRD